MDEKSTKTSTKQRIIIGIIAFLMLGSTIAVYIAIVIGGSNNNSNSSVDETQINQLSEQYSAKQAEVDAAAKDYSDQYFPTFSKYLGQVKAFNAATANSEGLKTTDLQVGSGATLGENDTNYFAYYIGWCANETIFDSSFDDSANPTSLKAPLDPAMGLIEGWTQGVVGMNLGGVRELTIPSELAYADSTTPCGEANSPLKFVVMAIEKTEPLATLSSELNQIYTKLLYAYYGMSAE